MSTFAWSISKPVVGKPLRAKSSPRGRPTYPNPMTPICAVLLCSFEWRVADASKLPGHASFIVIDSRIGLWGFDSPLVYYNTVPSNAFRLLVKPPNVGVRMEIRKSKMETGGVVSLAGCCGLLTTHF